MKTSKIETAGIKRVVVRGVNWVGDAVMTVPALRQLRALLPDSHISLATSVWTQGIFQDAGFIDDLLLFNKSGGLLGYTLKQAFALRRGKFDLAIVLPNSFNSAFVPWLAGVNRIFGHDSDGRKFFLTDPIGVPSWKNERHEIYYYLNLIEALRARLVPAVETLSETPDAVIEVSEERRQVASQLLRKNGVQSAGPIIALCPGSTNSRAKRWPPDRFASLGDMFIRNLGASVVIIGAPDELETSQQVAALMNCPAAVLTGETSLSEAVAVLSCVDALVGNDTGPAHIAAALGRPTTVIFGPTNPNTTRPFSESAIIIREPPDCAPCMLRDCPIDHRCMTAITPRFVFDQTVVRLNEFSREGV